MNCGLIYRIGLLSVICLASQSVLAQSSFEGIGDLSGGGFESGANAVSGDGSVVVGRGLSGNVYPLPGTEAFRWTAANGMEGLGDVSGGSFGSNAFGVSRDGTTIVGQGQTTQDFTPFRAWVWTTSNGIQPIPDGASVIPTIANGVSSNGLIVTGAGSKKSSLASGAYIYYRDSNILEDPGNFFAGGTTILRGVSADGSTAFGSSPMLLGPRDAVIWTDSNGLQSLPHLNQGDAEVRAANRDASILVGQSGSEAVMWDSSQNVSSLGVLPFANNSVALGVSDDGSVIIGNASGVPFIWKPAEGMRPLDEFIEKELCVDLSDWTLISANSISSDGQTIVGVGLGPNGEEAWVARLAPRVPGDFNGDRLVDAGDAAVLVTCLSGPMVSLPPQDCSVVQYECSDLQGDGRVDLLDFAEISKQVAP
jgi:uncharacterized membrane protein